MTEAVEGDVLVNSCVCNPILKFCLYEAIVEAFEYFAFAGSAAEFVGFFGDWKSGTCLGLLGGDAKAVAAVRVLGDVFPFEVADIAEAQTCEAAE